MKVSTRVSVEVDGREWNIEAEGDVSRYVPADYFNPPEGGELEDVTYFVLKIDGVKPIDQEAANAEFSRLIDLPENRRDLQEIDHDLLTSDDDGGECDA
jgi:hypothetical protein